jgi:hypothetical protein
MGYEFFTFLNKIDRMKLYCYTDVKRINNVRGKLLNYFQP